MVKLALAVFGTVCLVGWFMFAFNKPMRARMQVLFDAIVWQIGQFLSTPLERELRLIARNKAVIDRAQNRLQDLRGGLQHERDALQLRRDELNDATTAYYGAVDNHESEEDVNAAALIVSEREQEVAIQQGVVNDFDAAVTAVYRGVSDADGELRRLRMTARSDEAKAKAGEALNYAARVIAEVKSISGVGGKLARESDAIRSGFEQSKARLEDARGTPGQRELAAGKSNAAIAALRKRLDAARQAPQQPDAATQS